MKSPHTQRPDNLAREETEKFIAANARTAKAKKIAEKAAEKAAEARA